MAFGETLGHFLNHPAAWRHLQHEAPLYAREWSDVAMAERLARLYSTIGISDLGQNFRPTVAFRAER